MRFKIPLGLRKSLKTTQFWQDNYLILREFKHFRIIAIFAVVFTLLAASFEGVSLGFLLAFLQNLTEPNAEPVHTGAEWFDVWILGVNSPPTEQIYRICALILIATLIRVSCAYAGKVFSGIAQSQLAYQLRLRLFEQLQSVSLSYFTKTRSGELVNSLTAEVMQVMQAFDAISFILIVGSTLLVYAIAMLLLSWQLTLISLMLFGLLSAGVSNLIKRVREASFERTKARSRYASVALEFINGIRTVQAFAAQDFERKRFHQSIAQIANTEIHSFRLSASVEPLTEGLASTIIIAMLIVAFASLIPQGQLQIASVLTFLFVLFRMVPMVRQLNNARAKIGSFQGSIRNIKELLRTDNKTYLPSGAIQFPGLQRAIEFRAVDFGYEPQCLVLHNATLTIKKGETTALVGASGAGKSTLVDLIPRFYDPVAGEILADGVNLKSFDLNSLRQTMAIVSQDTFIFNASVRDNIAYAIENIHETAIEKAARQANAWEFIQELPEGLDTQLGDRGIRLSGGQRQRIAIARALLRNPEILILDEATSALDSVSERLIQESLEKLSVGRTVIAIAHRLSTIVRADKVVVLDRGRIVEQGKYQELLEQRGQLWNYHQMQHEMDSVNLS
ncbi:MAG: heterocyst formation ABC transporter subunit HepA [Cyanobacteriota bacterium]|nr:heterocyst formation ABC transporter subunit HepA [Cyanobacteriota bacterium]